jgi:hypothetical protein
MRQTWRFFSSRRVLNESKLWLLFSITNILTLPLLVLRLKFVNNVDTAFTTHNLVVGANLFYTCTYFHVRITAVFLASNSLH